MDTKDNLKEAFAGESQANQTYRAFAKKAEQDGFSNIARLFRTTAEAERIHAEGHLKALAEIGATTDNLQAAIAGETHEYTAMYPPMLQQAEAEGHRAKRMFGYAVKAEAVHAKLYGRALEAAGQGQDLAEARFYLCPVCGNIEFGVPPGRCPICGAPAAKFVEVA
jgi:rubrerythrin